ncbi:hypothetical protein GCM10009020_05940 [Natronoarchaeum mannanilyticum]|uniref:LppX_LprAFG lipoprotein n=2 Tax=Natronoarchaeum mannanilyticum TaxID=926360 RepID=A0AAV3T5G8_9EURY
MVGLAGCSTTDGDGGDSGDGNATDGSDGATLSEEYPPGVTDDGLDDTQAIVDATKTALVENGYDVTSTLVSGSAENAIEQRYRSSLDQKRHFFRFDSSSSTIVSYAESDRTYRKTSQGGETDYASRATEQSIADLHTSADIVAMLGSPESLGGILDRGRFVPDAMAEYNGRDVVAFEFDGVVADQIQGTIEDPSGKLLVSPEGVVFDAALSMTVSSDGNAQAYETTFTINALGSVDVQRPSWVGEQF